MDAVAGAAVTEAVVLLAVAVVAQALALAVCGLTLPWLWWRLTRLERATLLRLGAWMKRTEDDLRKVDQVVSEHLATIYGRPGDDEGKDKSGNY